MFRRSLVLTEVYRCKVRKPSGEIVDGCGLEFTLPELRGSSKCSCGGFFRSKVTEPQIHGGPLVVEAHRSTQAGSPEDKEARQEVLRVAHNRLSALRMGTAMGRTADDGTIRETIALLQSLLPASPIADAQAQVDMAAEHNASATARSIFALVKTVCGRGGDVRVGACDMLNPACGYQARATWPDGSRNGHSERASSGMYEPSADNHHGDHTADPIEALARLAARVAR